MLDNEQYSPVALFLSLLAADLSARPGTAVHPLPKAMASRVEILVRESGLVDLDAPIVGDVSL